MPVVLCSACFRNGQLFSFVQRCESRWICSKGTPADVELMPWKPFTLSVQKFSKEHPQRGKDVTSRWSNISQRLHSSHFYLCVDTRRNTAHLAFTHTNLWTATHCNRSVVALLKTLSVVALGSFFCHFLTQLGFKAWNVSFVADLKFWDYGTCCTVFNNTFFWPHRSKETVQPTEGHCVLGVNSKSHVQYHAWVPQPIYFNSALMLIPVHRSLWVRFSLDRFFLYKCWLQCCRCGTVRCCLLPPPTHLLYLLLPYFCLLLTEITLVGHYPNTNCFTWQNYISCTRLKGQCVVFSVFRYMIITISVGL